MVEPLVVCVGFPPDADVTGLRSRLTGLPRPVQVLTVGHGEHLDGTAPCAALAGAEVLVTLQVPGDILDRAPRLRWIQAVGSGVERFPLGELHRHGVLITNAAGVGAIAIAEFVLARILEVWKDLRELNRLQTERRWEPAFGRTLHGSTIGIVGLGAIGREVATRARAFGMRVIASRRRATPGMASEYADELLGPDRLHDLLARSDIVVLAAPATGETVDLIDRRALAAMKPGAVLCNVSRGELVDESALVEALHARALRAAILDVVRTEPLPAQHPLWSTPGLYLSPHSAVSADGYIDRVLDLLADNLARYVHSQPLHNLVEPAGAPSLTKEQA
jgi:phosphoglycerate dehydrogenase-like enzyme